MQPQSKKLEEYKIFPYIAWTICILFAGFVLNLSLQLSVSVEEMQDSNLNLEYRVQTIERMLEGEAVLETAD